MKDGTKVKVKARQTGHGFRLGQIVERRASEHDDAAHFCVSCLRGG